MPLSDLKIRKLKQRDKAFRISDGWGLYLLVRPTGTKSWQFRYQFMGKEKTLSIGQYPVVSLADARRKRDDAKMLLAEGKDPSIQKQLDRIDAHVKARMTFKEIADEYYDNLVDRGLAPATLRKKRWQIEDLAKLTCHGIFPPDRIRVRPNEGTDNEAIKICGRTDHRHFDRARGRREAR